MRYLIEESDTGNFLVRYSSFEKLPDAINLSEEIERIVDILRVWETNLLTDLVLDDIIDEFGINISTLKKLVGECLGSYQFPEGEWIRVNILNVM